VERIGRITRSLAGNAIFNYSNDFEPSFSSIALRMVLNFPGAEIAGLSPPSLELGFQEYL
jgi:hypothetical protein